MSKDGLKVGDTVEAEVLKINNFGAFVRTADNRRGLIHISQVSDDFVNDISRYLKVGDKVNARVKSIGRDGKIDLTLKKKAARAVPAARTKGFRTAIFGEKLEAFLKKKE